ncbi:homeobox-leucine zipper protein HOX11-like [Cornus florida]|uniref:homeobox-leucine zipper protein HOX11-like n=1 Tax=Cornus florida TaxID=4283 RepID=UPI002898AB6C|nr:homeobox-leucine zipper protein HOX11-like [Cornus florida]
MELGLSLGDASKPFGFLSKDHTEIKSSNNNNTLGFCMALGITSSNGRQEQEREKTHHHHHHHQSERNGTDQTVSVDPPVQLNLLPLSPVPRHSPSYHQSFPWPSDNGSSDGGSSGNMGARGFDVNVTPRPAAVAEVEEGAAASSPNSAASSFQMDFCIYRGGGSDGGGNKRDSSEAAAGNDVVDEDENGLTRKKLRLSKEQSAYLEDSFKEHNTLNPKQKLALAKQLNLRPRQVEVWFQNRRARTKLKQTEVDCEYLKRCCETLTEENRRLQKELQELRALKTTSNPFYMQLPATTLTMCPSCERVATTSTAAAAAAKTANEPTSTKPTHPFPLSRPRFYPFSHPQPNPPTSS